MKIATATGRRKTSVAQCRIIPGNGKIVINNRSLEEYYPLEPQRIKIMQPLILTKLSNKYDILINVRGGGKSGQLGAIQLGISRAIVDLDDNFHQTLRDAGLLTRDPRMVERKKYGRKKARKRFQFSKR